MKSSAPPWRAFTASPVTLRCGFRLTVQAGEAEHADLLSDVVPGPRGAQSLQLAPQLRPHQQHSVRHRLHVSLPEDTKNQQLEVQMNTDKHLHVWDEQGAPFENWSGAYHSANSSGLLSVLLTTRAPWEGGLDQVVLTIFSIWDRVRVRLSPSLATTVRFPTLSSAESGELKPRLYSQSGVDRTQSRRSLTVKAEVLGEWLSDEELEALGDEEADGPGVLVQVSRSKTLISRVEESKQLPPLVRKRRTAKKKLRTFWYKSFRELLESRKKRFTGGEEGLTFMISAMVFHSSWVGSVPVGLCAQAWRTKTECSGAFCRRRKSQIGTILQTLMKASEELFLGLEPFTLKQRYDVQPKQNQNQRSTSESPKLWDASIICFHHAKIMLA